MKRAKDFTANTYLEVQNTKTPIDLILHHAATSTVEDFMSWLTIHADDLKQAEINLLGKTYFEGLSYPPFDRFDQTVIYIKNNFKHLPKL
jgi:hypothetical protein